MADLTLKTITKGMEDGAETINDNFDATKTKINNDLADTGWKNITLASGYTATSSLRTPQYRKIGSKVIIQGAITGEAGVMATLPYKPAMEQGFLQPLVSGSAAEATVYVETDGTLKLVVASNYTKGVWLTGIEYFTD